MRLRWVLLIFFAALAVAELGLLAFVDSFGQTDRAQQAPAIVVLGARVHASGEASDSLRARVEKGVSLYKAGIAPLLVFSGGVGDHGPAEAIAAQRLAESLGVPPEACVVEPESHNTFENARNTTRLLEARGIDSVVLVSDPYHLFRARQLFRAQGIDSATSPALDAERNRKPLDRLFWTFRETVALWLHPSLFIARR
jgi:uncharacterized SAM-binding protein YcdF (DUF218 family)